MFAWAKRSYNCHREERPETEGDRRPETEWVSQLSTQSLRSERELLQPSIDSWSALSLSAISEKTNNFLLLVSQSEKKSILQSITQTKLKYCYYRTQCPELGITTSFQGLSGSDSTGSRLRALWLWLWPALRARKTPLSRLPLIWTKAGLLFYLNGLVLF